MHILGARSGYPTSTPRCQRRSGSRSSRRSTASHVDASCARERCPRTRGKPLCVPKLAVGSVPTPQKVCQISVRAKQGPASSLLSSDMGDVARTRPTGNEGPTRCVRCQTAISNTDAVLDALRVGQEALVKASSLQFKGALLLLVVSLVALRCHPYSRTLTDSAVRNACRPGESQTAHDEHHSHPRRRARHALCASSARADARPSGAADCVTVVLSVSGYPR